MQQLAPSPSQHGHPIPYGRVSLQEMMNFSLYAFGWALRIARQDCTLAAQWMKGDHTAAMTEEHKNHFTGNFDFLQKTCRDNNLLRADDRVGRVRASLQVNNGTYVHYLAEMNTLLEAIDDDIKYEYYFHYPRDKYLLFSRIPGDWPKTIEAFKSARVDLDASVDCYALGYDTASVFHMMRVAEIGLRALAMDQKFRLSKDKTLTHLQWGDILVLVEKKASIVKNAKAGHKKDAALAFYNGAAAHIRALKDKYRNRVMHARESFNQHEAADAIFHTRLFMEGLSEKLTDTTSRQIRWGV